MTDKVLCPWCGSDMHICCSQGRVLGEWRDYHYAHLRCTKCGARGPSRRGDTPKGAKEAALAAALRRYEPPCRPLTKEDFEAVYDAREDHEWPYEAIPPYLFLESHIEKDEYCWMLWCGACDLWEIGYRKYTRDTYGKTWRCWPRKPTDEERAEAGWEDAE